MKQETIQFDERLRKLEYEIAYLIGVLSGLVIGMTILG